MNPEDCTCEHVHCSSRTCRSIAPSKGAVPESERLFPARPIEPSAPAAARYVSVAWIERVIVDLERKAHTLRNPELITVAVETLKAFLPGEPLRPPDAAIDARLAAGERGIPKIPDGPDTRHAISSADNAGRCSHGVWLADHCHECAKIVAAESAAIEEAMRVVDRMTCKWCYDLNQFPLDGMLHKIPPHGYVSCETSKPCTKDGRAIIDAILPILRSGK